MRSRGTFGVRCAAEPCCGVTTQQINLRLLSDKNSSDLLSELYEEIRLFREACGEAHMKTILGTGELGSLTNVYKASLVAMMAGE